VRERYFSRLLRIDLKIGLAGGSPTPGPFHLLNWRHSVEAIRPVSNRIHADAIMLVTFTTKAYADITMFGDVALGMLKMMGHSESVPGAIPAEDVPAALERLKRAIERAKAAGVQSPPRPTRSGDSDEQAVSLAHRALPLIELLAAAARENCDVMWK
jgi:hypothetical protein